MHLRNIRIEDAGEYKCSPLLIGFSANAQQPAAKIDLIVIEASSSKKEETIAGGGVGVHQHHPIRLKSEKVMRKPGEQAEQVCTGKSSALDFDGSIIIDWFNSHGQVR